MLFIIDHTYLRLVWWWWS